MPIEPYEILETVYRKGVSHLHIQSGMSPVFRIAGRLQTSDFDRLDEKDIDCLVDSLLSEEQLNALERDREICAGLAWAGVGRFLASICKTRTGFSVTLEVIPNPIGIPEELDLPSVITSDVLQRNSGLVLITGPRNSGKSTTLASMIEWINQNRSVHIITIEKPIWYLHRHKKSIVSQVELDRGDSYAASIRSALKQSPDVVQINDLVETAAIEAALDAAESGQLVFGMLDSNSAKQAVERLTHTFSGNERQRIDIQLAHTLVAVLNQTLIRRKTPAVNVPMQLSNEIAAVEILINSPAVASLIREQKTAQLYSVMQTGSAGMQTRDMALATLIKDGVVDAKNVLL